MTAPLFTRCQATGCCNLIAPPRHHKPRKWCSERCRKSQYARPCVDCGKPCDGASGKSRLAVRCRVCAPLYRHREAQRNIMAAMREWVTLTGRPPSAADWNPSHPKHRPRAETKYRSWPWVHGVTSIYGSWNAAIRAAGFTPMPIGMKRDAGAHKEALRKAHGTQARREQIAALFREGMTYPEIGARMGVGARTVESHVRRMRLEGWDLPYRTPGRKKATA